jgi:hypothetical protein
MEIPSGNQEDAFGEVDVTGTTRAWREAFAQRRVMLGDQYVSNRGRVDWFVVLVRCMLYVVCGGGYMCLIELGDGVERIGDN